MILDFNRGPLSRSIYVFRRAAVFVIAVPLVFSLGGCDSKSDAPNEPTTARMIASGAVTERGVFFPEQLFAGDHYATFVAELSAKGVSVTHTIQA